MYAGDLVCKYKTPAQPGNRGHIIFDSLG